MREFFLQALQSPLGIAIATPEPERLRAKLYTIRAQVPEFQSIHICIPAEPQRVWLVRTEAFEK